MRGEEAQSVDWSTPEAGWRKRDRDVSSQNGRGVAAAVACVGASQMAMRIVFEPGGALAAVPRGAVAFDAPAVLLAEALLMGGE